MENGQTMSSSGKLPFVDEHAIEIDAPPETTWDALCEVVGGSFGGALTSWFTALIGCADRKVNGRLEELGATIPGFHVVHSHRPEELALEGSHRFSRYALLFQIEDLGGARSRLRAVTRAEFPGETGRLYRLLVIGTGAHVLAMRRLLHAIRSRASRA